MTDASGNVIERIAADEVERLIADGVVTGGMATKLRAAALIVSESHTEIVITSAEQAAPGSAISLAVVRGLFPRRCRHDDRSDFTPASLAGSHLLSITDLDRDQILAIVENAIAIKKHPPTDAAGRVGCGPDLRSRACGRVSFEVGLPSRRAGRISITARARSVSESVKDLAGYLQRTVQAIVAGQQPCRAESSHPHRVSR